MKIKNILLLFLFVLSLMLLPNKVFAAISGGECFDRFGEIQSVVRGNDSSQIHISYGHVEYNKAYHNNTWSDTPVTFELQVQAPSGGKVTEISYNMNSDDQNSCSGTIPSYSIDGNNGDVTMKIKINKSIYLQSLSFYGKATNSSGQIVDIDSSTLSIKYNPKSTSTDEEASLDKLGPGETLACSDLSDLLNKYWTWVVIICPVLLIFLISIDFTKATIGIGGAEAIKKASTDAVRRTAALILLLFSPYILNFIFGLAGIDFCF